MIISFRHKGLRRLHETGSTAGVRPEQAFRIQRVLTTLDRISTAEEADLPNFGLHALKGKLQTYWSISISGNWRLTFRMQGSDAADLDLVDYH